MENWQFTDADRWQMAALGLSEAQVVEQLSFYRRPRFSLELARPCTLGDGIHLLPVELHQHYLLLHQRACEAGRFVKFVPASGAASRMFEAPINYLSQISAQWWVEGLRLEEACPPPDPRLETFCRSLEQFAFFPDLAKTMASHGFNVQEVMASGRYHCAIYYLLSDRGLKYGLLPKGLLKFHRYPDESRTAFEEHLVEAVGYVKDARGCCRLHFTILPEHGEFFAHLAREVVPAWERRLGCRFQLEFSSQSHATDTLAVDLENRPFREEDGRLHFRPGGHGALLDNLQGLAADLVYMKNIDNVVPDRLKEPTIYWKKLLGGLLVEVEGRLHELLRRLEVGLPDAALAQEAADFARRRLLLSLPPDFSRQSPARQRDILMTLLNRPLRVCGVVKNDGEPGGAPFWVREPDGSLSLQIVEGAQVNLESPTQRDIWEAATHFNPVDLAVSMRDFRGRPFDLTRFANPEAVFISRKTRNGRELKALERPGLWNGAMARWLTVFVEVPRITFNPVKTALDLLRPEHLPEAT